MISAEVKRYLKEIGIERLYKKFEKYFNLVDTWATQFVEGDLLNELELSKAMDQLTGVYAQFHTIAGAIDAYKTNQELSYKEAEFKNCRESKQKINVSQLNEEARASTKKLREYRADFQNYADSAEKFIGTCQSRLKRLTVEKGAKRVDHTGETPTE